MSLVRDGVQPPTFPSLTAAPGRHESTAASPGHPVFEKPALLLCACLIALAWAAAGCGTSANLAGLGVSVNVAQKGLIAGATFSASSNSVTIGGSYSQGTNVFAGTATVPTN